MEEKQSFFKKYKFGILFLIALFILAFTYDLRDSLSNYFDKIIDNKPNVVTNKNVNITDEGLAEVVEDVYNATVIVKIYKQNRLTSFGSGFVYKIDDKYGYILTNHHVVDDSETITIEYNDGTTVDGKLLGGDMYADVAVVRVDKDSVIAVAKTSTDDVRLGDTVFAVGTPVSLDYSFSVTRGIISGKDRLVACSDDSSSSYNSIFSTNTVSDSWYMRLLQIDASINAGNSGGPLANVKGEVIGITNSKLSNRYSSISIENMGFAIPIEDALSVAELVEKGKTPSNEKAKLGVSMTTIDGAEANKITIDKSIKKGVVVIDVVKGSNADAAKLKSGDVIIKYNDNEVPNYKYLKYYLYKSNIGDKVKLTYIRDGKEEETTITLKK